MAGNNRIFVAGGVIACLAGVLAWWAVGGDPAGSDPGEAAAVPSDGGERTATTRPSASGPAARPSAAVDEADPTQERLDGLPSFDELPEAHRPAAMEALTESLAAEMGTLESDAGVELGDLDCERPPCLVQLTIPSGQEADEELAEILGMAEELGSGRMMRLPAPSDEPGGPMEMSLVWIPDERPELGSAFQLEGVRRTQGLPE